VLIEVKGGELNDADWIAVYAAIVATGALALEIRRWFDSGPKLRVKATPGMTMVDSQTGRTEDGYLVATVRNQGDAQTTITHFTILDYPNAWLRYRNKPVKSFVVVRPGGQALPHVLQPGTEWMGVVKDRTGAMGDLQIGTMWLGIYTTNRKRPYLARIPKVISRPELKGASNV
jgi:hypothetical protein